MYPKDLRELNTKCFSELNVGLENLDVIALCIQPFIYNCIIILLNIKVNNLNSCNEKNANGSRQTDMNPFLRHRRIKNVCWVSSNLWDPKLLRKNKPKKIIIMIDIFTMVVGGFFSRSTFWFLRVGTSFDLKSTYS